MVLWEAEHYFQYYEIQFPCFKSAYRVRPAVNALKIVVLKIHSSRDSWQDDYRQRYSFLSYKNPRTHLTSVTCLARPSKYALHTHVHTHGHTYERESVRPQDNTPGPQITLSEGPTQRRTYISVSLCLYIHLCKHTHTHFKWHDKLETCETFFYILKCYWQNTQQIYWEFSWNSTSASLFMAIENIYRNISKYYPIYL